MGSSPTVAAARAGAAAAKAAAMAAGARAAAEWARATMARAMEVAVGARAAAAMVFIGRTVGVTCLLEGLSTKRARFACNLSDNATVHCHCLSVGVEGSKSR